MTRKDFELIARVFAREMSLEGGDAIARRHIVSGVARMIATEFARTNDRFDRGRFLTACRVTS